MTDIIDSIFTTNMVKGKCHLLPVATFPVNDGRVDDGSYVSRPHYVGNSILLYGKRNTRFPAQAFIGGDFGCMMITYLLISIPTVFFLIDVGPVLGSWVYIIGIVTFLLTIMYVLYIYILVYFLTDLLVLLIHTFLNFHVCRSFSITACSDPGIIFDYLDERSVVWLYFMLDTPTHIINITF